MTLTRTTDHETALAGGFDIVRPGYWVRPDSAEVWRWTGRIGKVSEYHARTSAGALARFWTMREAVEWIGPVDHDCTCPDCLERAEERYAYARDNWYS